MSGVRASTSTRVAGLAIVCIIAASAAYLAWRYPALPSLLPVHFKRSGAPDGWQFRTPMRVLLPVLVQLALAATLGMVGVLLLSRPHGDEDPDALDVKAAAAAAEAVILIALIWVAFQAFGAWALVSMWSSGAPSLGFLYSYLELTGVVLTAIVAVRAHLRLGRPEPRPFVAEHWRYGQLYKNASDPALFVPTRDGR
jgi:uncharacterized membrane protein